MAGSESRRNDALRSRKATAVGCIVGAIVFFLTYYAESATPIVVLLQKVVEMRVAFGEAVAQLFGVSTWLAAGETWLQSSGAVTTVGIPFATALLFASMTRGALLTDKPLGYPLIDRIWSCVPDILAPSLEREGLPRYRALAAGQPFLERDDDMKHLRRFAENAAGPPVKFMYIKGKEGIGKTRLGLQWLKEMKTLGWDVGILDPGAKPLDVRRSRFRRKTAILIDEPESLLEIWQILDEFLRCGTNIRIVLANQVSLRPPASLDVEVRRRIAGAEAPPLHLGGLDRKALAALAPDASADRLADAGGCPLVVLLTPDDYGAARDFAELERWGARLIAVAETPAFVGDQDIRLEEAKGAVNAIKYYGSAGPALEGARQQWWRRLAKAARDFPAYSEIQNLANRYNLTYTAQAVKGWPYGAPASFRLVHKS